MTKGRYYSINILEEPAASVIRVVWSSLDYPKVGGSRLFENSGICI